MTLYLYHRRKEGLMDRSASISQDEEANAWSVSISQAIVCDDHFFMGNCGRMKKTKPVHIYINYYITYQQNVWSIPLHCS